MTLQPIENRDTGDETLFETDTLPRRCPACRTTSKNLCRFSADLAHGIHTGSRPKGCLNARQPEGDA